MATEPPDTDRPGGGPHRPVPGTGSRTDTGMGPTLALFWLLLGGVVVSLGVMLGIGLAGR
ncbi:MAG: hypothetical protein J0H73_17345 [Salana multivorans]|uniref:hypothetical protein n=1 Tax=Salana multivorans TaxID=120377 RepID=UPI001AC396E6|nr:hypothetical protein [Salana multivorans]MBN8884060.1 hypothetical protein [Salana multivorans]